MTLTDAVMEAILTLITDTGGPFDPAALYLGVATALTDNGADTVQADVTAATGAMATRQAVNAWGSPYKLNDGRWATDGPLLHFSPASSSENQTLTHWFLNSAATAGTLKAFAAIPGGISLVDEFSVWSIIVRVTVDPLGRWSAEVTYNG